MTELVLHPTTTAQWQSLLAEAQQRCSLVLHEDLESYLVFLLMRYTANAEMAHSVLALEYLNCQQQTHCKEQLRDVGDKCLLYAGLFPGRAQRKRVRTSYFIDLGQGAYTTLSEIELAGLANVFSELASEFVSLMSILQATRDITDPMTGLDPLSAHDLWADTQSAQVLVHLQQFTAATPIATDTTKKDYH